MPRRKLNLAYIPNNSLRKRTFNLRKTGLLKKLDEIKILCDVDACAVIYSPYTSAPEVWPSNSKVHEVMDKFEMMPEDELTKKSANHEEYLTQTLTKVKTQVKRLSQDNNDKLMNELMFSCLDGNMGDLAIDDGSRGKLCEYIEVHLNKLHHHRVSASLQAGSSFFTSPQQNNESQLPLVTSNQGPEHIGFHGSQFLNVPTSTNQGLQHVPSLGNNFMSAPIFNPPQVTNEMQQPMITSNQGSDYVDALASSLLPFRDHGVNTPVMNQDEINYPLNQQDWYVEGMMKDSEQTSFPWMEENNYYNNHQL